MEQGHVKVKSSRLTLLRYGSNFPLRIRRGHPDIPRQWRMNFFYGHGDEIGQKMFFVLFRHLCQLHKHRRNELYLGILIFIQCVLRSDLYY